MASNGNGNGNGNHKNGNGNGNGNSNGKKDWTKASKTKRALKWIESRIREGGKERLERQVVRTKERRVRAEEKAKIATELGTEKKKLSAARSTVYDVVYKPRRQAISRGFKAVTDPMKGVSKGFGDVFGQMGKGVEAYNQRMYGITRMDIAGRPLPRTKAQLKKRKKRLRRKAKKKRAKKRTKKR